MAKLTHYRCKKILISKIVSEGDIGTSLSYKADPSGRVSDDPDYLVAFGISTEAKDKEWYNLSLDMEDLKDIVRVLRKADVLDYLNEEDK